MALHRKLPVLADRLGPDIAIVPECANEEILRRKGGRALPEVSMVWKGRLKDKGLAVFGFGDYEVSLAECYDDRLEWVLPIAVTGPVNFALLAVWASNHRARIQHPDHVGVPQPASALTVYEDWIRNQTTVLAGDFNHNCVWDKPGQVERNHAETVAAASRAGMVSIYHEWFDESQGHESKPTIYWRNRTLDGPAYHIDYIFIPERWSHSVSDMHVGGFDEWVGSGLSDHVPVLMEVCPSGPEPTG